MSMSKIKLAITTMRMIVIRMLMVISYAMETLMSNLIIQVNVS